MKKKMDWSLMRECDIAGGRGAQHRNKTQKVQFQELSHVFANRL